MNRLLIVASLLSFIMPLCAHGQQNVAKLKADAQKIVSSISHDKAKVRAYCEITDLGRQIVEAAQEKNEKKADALMERMDQLEKILGPEYPALFDALYEADSNSKVFRTFCRCSLCSTSPVRNNSHRPRIANEKAERASSPRAGQITPYPRRSSIRSNRHHSIAAMGTR
jgi:hypothetical protein